MNELNKEIGLRIKKRLAMSGKSQADLAAYMNVSPTAVSSWINGRKIPRMDKLDKICDFVHCTRSDLLIESFSNKENHLRIMNSYYMKLNSQNRQSIDSMIMALFYAQGNHFEGPQEKEDK